MRLATVEQSREIERMSRDEFLLPDEILMEAAGALAAREIEQAFYPELKRGDIGIVCGPGHNGADGLVVARHLHASGYRDLTIFLAAPDAQRRPLMKIQLERAERQGIPVVDILDENMKSMPKLQACTLVIDSLFGIGLRSAVLHPYQSLIEVMNSVQCPIASLDVPSGLESNTGQVLGVAIRATMTITFGLPKPGFFVNEGPNRVGRLRTLAVGFPHEAFRKAATTHFAFTEKLARRYLPRRKDTANKSQHGRVLMFAGQSGMWGAGILAASSAYRMGAGYVTLASHEDPTVVLRDLPEVLTAKSDDESIWQVDKYTAVGVGPGLGVGQKTADIITRLKKEGFTKVVIDADAITTCVEFNLFPLPETWVMTPHAGELSRILKLSSHEIERDRFAAAFSGATQTGCHVLLKGFRSVLAEKDRCLVIMSGNSALAKAGTGDVLTGMVAGLLAQNVPTVQASATAAFIHGRMADEWVRSGHDKRGLTASDLREQLPLLMQRLSSGVIL